mgnify:CR=1 FL=1
MYVISSKYLQTSIYLPVKYYIFTFVGVDVPFYQTAWPRGYIPYALFHFFNILSWGSHGCVCFSIEIGCACEDFVI